MKVNNWELLCFHLFRKALLYLAKDVERLKRTQPRRYKLKANFKLFEAVCNCIYNIIPFEEHKEQFALKDDLKGLYRIKRNLYDDRYRLFFKPEFQKKELIYIWLNDKKTLRKDGSKTDPYKKVSKDVNNGTIPINFDEIRAQSAALPDKASIESEIE